MQKLVQYSELQWGEVRSPDRTQRDTVGETGVHCSTCAVHVQYMCSTCAVPVQYMCSTVHQQFSACAVVPAHKILHLQNTVDTEHSGHRTQWTQNTVDTEHSVYRTQWTQNTVHTEHSGHRTEWTQNTEHITVQNTQFHSCRVG